MQIYKSILISTIFFVGVAADARVDAFDSERELRVAVQNLNSWLGADSKARQWRQILDLNILDSQAALGHRANAKALYDVSRCFDADIDGLDHPVFRNVKRCIDAHLDQMARNNSDVLFATEQAKFQFQNASVDDLDQIRDQAIYNVNMLKRFYKVRLRSRERALLYYALQPDETVDLLANVEFEVAPARTKKIIESEIAAIDKTIESIDQQIEELNAQREKVLEWLTDPGTPADAQPPMPDDDGPELNDNNDNAANAEITSPETTTSVNPKRQEEIKRIENGRTLLLQEKADLQRQLSQLKQEIQNIADSEKQRVSRFRLTLGDLNSILSRYEGQQAERNDLYFSHAYDSLLRLKSAYLAAANPNTKKQYLSRLARIQEIYSSRIDLSDRRAAAEIGNLTGWLDGAQQANDLVANVRTRYSLPNLYLDFSSGLVTELAGRNVREVRRVNEQILSRLIRGHAFVNGNVSVQFVPDPYQAHAAIDFTGNINSDTYTRSGKFTAYAGAFGQFNVRRDFFANVGGMFSCDVYGDLQLGTFFKCIDSSWRLVQKIALKQYYKSKLQAEAISRERTIAKIFPQFEQETEASLAGGFDQFQSLIEQQTDNGRLIPSLYMFTTADRLVAVGHQATIYDLAATNQPQYFDGIASDVHLKLHESMLSNYISPLLAGKRLTNDEIAAQFEQLLGRSIAADDGDDSEDFSVLFDDVRPIQVEFEGNLLSVTIFGKEFSRDGNRIRDGLKIHLDFKVENYGDHLVVKPDSNVSVELIDEKRTNIGTVSFKNFLADRLSDVMAKAAESEQPIPMNLIPLENLGPAVSAVAEQLQLVQFRTEAGWLYLGWKYHANQASVQSLVDTPAIWNRTFKMAPENELQDIPAGDDLNLQDQLDASETIANPSSN